MLKIGVSANFFHADPSRSTYAGRPLLYLEQSMGHWVMARGAAPYLLPAALPDRDDAALGARDLLEPLDGLILQGGADVDPRTYGESPIQPQWQGDAARDRYEIDLVEAAVELGLPILGICRGIQLINVWRGGSLYQDLPTQWQSDTDHRDGAAFQANTHRMRIEEGSYLSSLYGGGGLVEVNSVHHQGIAELGDGLIVEARAEDGLIEAVRLVSDEAPFVFGVQWHPEFQAPAETHLLEPWPILDDFLARAEAAR